MLSTNIMAMINRDNSPGSFVRWAPFFRSIIVKQNATDPSSQTDERWNKDSAGYLRELHLQFRTPFSKASERNAKTFFWLNYYYNCFMAFESCSQFSVYRMQNSSNKLQIKTSVTTNVPQIKAIKRKPSLKAGLPSALEQTVETEVSCNRYCLRHEAEDETHSITLTNNLAMGAIMHWNLKNW